VQLARSVRNRTTGVLYVLDEPSIGLHPANVDGLLEVMRDLIADGNSVVMVDHDTRILSHADWLVEMGPGAGKRGGRVIAEGPVDSIESNGDSLIGPFLGGSEAVAVRERVPEARMFDLGCIHLETDAVHTVKPLRVDIPRGRLVVVTGVSGSGKTTLVLECLVPALRALVEGEALPPAALDCAIRPGEERAADLVRVNLIDATPIGINSRSTVATYSGVLDDVRRAYARTPDAKERGLKAGDFSYNTGKLRCPTCDGTGSISLDVQFLPDVEIVCPDCHGSRYAPCASEVHRSPAKGEDGGSAGLTLPEVMALDVDEAIFALGDIKKVRSRLQILSDLGLGYLTLGEATPVLSGGEAQRLKLASEMRKGQEDALFVFDEPTIGLHPLNVRELLGVFDELVSSGATVVVIEHDVDVISQADYVIDLGPGGGENGGRVVVAGTPEQVAACPESVTGRYL
jgi:excinuclease ABC subunit A